MIQTSAALGIQGQGLVSTLTLSGVTFENGAAEFVQRTVNAQSPVAGAKLEAVEIPQGLIVAAVLRGGEARIPRGRDRLEAGDEAILFVRRAELDLVQLLFPTPDAA